MHEYAFQLYHVQSCKILCEVTNSNPNFAAISTSCKHYTSMNVANKHTNVYISSMPGILGLEYSRPPHVRMHLHGTDHEGKLLSGLMGGRGAAFGYKVYPHC